MLHMFAVWGMQFLIHMQVNALADALLRSRLVHPKPTPPILTAVLLVVCTALNCIYTCCIGLPAKLFIDSGILQPTSSVANTCIACLDNGCDNCNHIAAHNVCNT